jgi:hypothetical protein
MTTETLKKRTTRYLQGKAMPAETRQIQTWLSCTDNKTDGLNAEERAQIENEILVEIQARTGYAMNQPKSNAWWKKFTAMF